jgi:hypothetical protein
MNFILFIKYKPCLQFLELFDKNAKQIFIDAASNASLKSRKVTVGNIFDYFKPCDNENSDEDFDEYFKVFNNFDNNSFNNSKLLKSRKSKKIKK